MRKERIGILGGTFNPVHCGHLKAAAAVRTRFSLDRILFIPSFIPPHKESAGIASAEERLKMVELAVRGRPAFLPSAVEIRAKGKSYSILTLQKIKSLYPRAWIFFILGVDAFLEIETWREWKRVLERCLFIVVTRPGYCLRDAEGILGVAYRGQVRSVSRFEKVREQWFLRSRIFLMPIAAADISSTEIRKRIREGRSIKGLVPAAVEDYIQRRGLYQKPAPRIASGPGASSDGTARKPRRG